MSKTDVIVVGGGPAGYVAALKASQLGASVCLVERRDVGGTCLNRGCIPTKTYLHNAEIIAHLKQAAERGIVIGDPSFKVDLTRAVAAKNAVVAPLVTGIRGLLASRKVKIIAGEARLTAADTVQVGEQVLVAGKGIVVAAGSSPARPPIPGADHPRVMTSDEILELTDMPSALVIVGAGVIGIEMAQIFRAYGVQVTLVEAEPTITPFLDAELASGLRAILERQGIAFRTASKVAAIETYADDSLLVRLADGQSLPASHVLIAVGRRADLSAFGDLPVAIERGCVQVDAGMRTSLPGVWAAGDVTGKAMLAHAAAKMGEVAAERIMGHAASFDASQVPGCIYGSPEAGWIGLTEAQAREKHGEVLVARFPFAANGRARCAGHADGFVKIVSDPAHHAILGVHILGPLASELINEAAALRASEITCDEWADMMHAHPTHAETLMEAAAAVLGRCLHLPAK